jgi:hypothetical protein
MSNAIAPPARTQAIASKPLSATRAQVKLDAFLIELRKRSVAGCGDGAVAAQLEKLSAALAEEQ